MVNDRPASPYAYYNFREIINEKPANSNLIKNVNFLIKSCVLTMAHRNGTPYGENQLTVFNGLLNC